MNRFISKNKEDMMPEDLLDQALRFYDEGKSVSDILALFPDHKEELSRIFESINILKNQRDIVVAPQERLTNIIFRASFGNRENLKEKAPSTADVTNAKDNRYLFRNDYTKGRFFNFNILKLFTMKKIYVGVIVLLLMVAVAGVSYRQSHRRGNVNLAASNLSVAETNKLLQDQETLAQDVAGLAELGANDDALSGISQDLADISGEKVVAEESSSGNKTGKAVNIAYIETLESNFGTEASGLSSDSQELAGISGDTALSGLDSELSAVQ